MRVVAAAAAVSLAPIRAVSARRSSSRARVTVRAASKPPTNEDGTVFDAYAVLEVPDSASGHVIRESFVALQKKYHPDVYPGDDADVRSANINRAYDILTDDRSRAALDAELLRANGGKRRVGGGKTILSAEGIVGPIRERLLERMDVCGAETPHACDVDVIDRMTESIREWGKMLAFTSELPLPLPLQCDDVEGGLRLAMVSYDGGAVREVGALIITVDTVVTSRGASRDGSDDAIKVQARVRRSWSEVANPTAYESNPLPGEGRVLANFREEFSFLVGESAAPGTTEKTGIEKIFSNVVSAVSSFALPVMPMFGGHDDPPPGGSYDGYRIKRAKKDENEEECEGEECPQFL